MPRLRFDVHLLVVLLFVQHGVLLSDRSLCERHFNDLEKHVHRLQTLTHWYMASTFSNTPSDRNMLDDPPAEHDERYAGTPVPAPRLTPRSQHNLRLAIENWENDLTKYHDRTQEHLSDSIK
eukprot:5368764-Amphidinium_carterae.1